MQPLHETCGYFAKIKRKICYMNSLRDAAPGTNPTRFLPFSRHCAVRGNTFEVSDVACRVVQSRVVVQPTDAVRGIRIPRSAGHGPGTGFVDQPRINNAGAAGVQSPAPLRQLPAIRIASYLTPIRPPNISALRRGVHHEVFQRQTEVFLHWSPAPCRFRVYLLTFAWSGLHRDSITG